VLDLPDHVAEEIGRHEVSILKLEDASGCEWEVHEQDRLSTVVDVVESARIVAVNSVEDLCVGDRLDFLLQGKAPWTIRWVKRGVRFTESRRNS
jgi:nucleoporin POM152